MNTTGEPAAVNSEEYRRAFSARTRNRIFRRDAFRCRQCGASPQQDPNIELQLAHLISIKDGARLGLPEWFINCDDNLAAWCRDCNNAQGGESLHLYEIVSFYWQLHEERRHAAFGVVTQLASSTTVAPDDDADDTEPSFAEQQRATIVEILADGRMIAAASVNAELRLRGLGMSNSSINTFLDHMVEDGLLVKWQGRYAHTTGTQQLGFQE